MGLARLKGLVLRFSQDSVLPGLALYKWDMGLSSMHYHNPGDLWTRMDAYFFRADPGYETTDFRTLTCGHVERSFEYSNLLAE